MRIRNITGIKQIYGQPSVRLDTDRWYDVPEDVSESNAWLAHKLRFVQLDFTGEEREMLWRESDGTHLHWMSPFSLGDGYATAAENMVHALMRRGMKLYIEQCWFVSRQGLLPETVRMLAEAMPGICRVGLCMATPGEFKKLPTPYRIGLTMYEADDPLVIHPEWKHDCAVVDLLVVPSEYCQEVFSRFVKSPIQVAPLAVNPIYYAPTERKRKDTFTFVTYGTLSGRKAPLETMELFKKVFPRESYPHVRLAFKTRLGCFGWGQNQLPQKINDPRITIHNTATPINHTDWSPERMRDWLLDADAMLFLSKGEGFGMPPREAMMTGLPVIFANHTGMTSLANDKYNWPVPVGREETSPLGGNWRLFDEDYTADVMRWMVDHREEAYHRAYLGGKWFVAHQGADAAGEILKGIIEGLHPEKAMCPKPLLGEAVTKANIATHQAFYDKVRELIPPPGPILDVGFGDGLACVALTKMGYTVYAAVKPRDFDAAEATLKREGITGKLYSCDLSKLDDTMRRHLGIPPVQAVVSQAYLQVLPDQEIKQIFRGLLTISKTILFSVPTVYYPTLYREGSRMMRLGEWRDRMIGFAIPMKYYGEDKQYLWGQVLEMGTLPKTEREGRMQDGVWHPLQRAEA